MDLHDKTLTQVDYLYGNGFITLEEAQAYVELWNQGPHFTKAIVGYNCIINVDKE